MRLLWHRLVPGVSNAGISCDAYAGREQALCPGSPVPSPHLTSESLPSPNHRGAVRWRIE